MNGARAAAEFASGARSRGPWRICHAPGRQILRSEGVSGSLAAPDRRAEGQGNSDGNRYGFCLSRMPGEHSMCTMANVAEGDLAGNAKSSNPEVQKIHGELLETMKGQCIPQSAVVFSLLQNCSSRDDVKLALDAVARLRTVKAVKGQQQANFSTKLSQLVVDACLRANDADNALKTIWEHNIYGFTPCHEAAHRILAYARDQQDLSLMQRTLKTMSLNSLAPMRPTADIALRLCKEQGKQNLLFTLAKEFHESGLKFRPALYDICISSAANAGEVKNALEIQRWRNKHKLPFTTASTFALAKVHLLKREPKLAAHLIHTHVQESEERDMYLRILVRAWPVEVLQRKHRSLKEVNLREDVAAMLDEMRALGSNILIDAAQEFGTGKETLRKPVYG